MFMRADGLLNLSEMTLVFVLFAMMLTMLTMLAVFVVAIALVQFLVGVVADLFGELNNLFRWFVEPSRLKMFGSLAKQLHGSVNVLESLTHFLRFMASIGMTSSEFFYLVAKIPFESLGLIASP
jgi:hypothetical protein